MASHKKTVSFLILILVSSIFISFLSFTLTTPKASVATNPVTTVNSTVASSSFSPTPSPAKTPTPTLKPTSTETPQSQKNLSTSLLTDSGTTPVGVTTSVPASNTLTYDGNNITTFQAQFNYYSLPKTIDNKGYSLQLNFYGVDGLWWQNVLVIPANIGISYCDWAVSVMNGTAGSYILQPYLPLPENVSACIVNNFGSLGNQSNDYVQLGFNNSTVWINVVYNSTSIYYNSFEQTTLTLPATSIQPVVVGQEYGWAAQFTQANFEVAVLSSSNLTVSNQLQETLESSNLLQSYLTNNSFGEGLG